MKLKPILFILLISLLSSCEKDHGERVWAYYNETQCANAWDNITESSTETRVKKYLESKGIQSFGIIIETYSYGPFCKACNCPSGRKIQVLIFESDIDAILKLGFIK